jgi:long-subunit acyl-CoA synthetase (AMP-forming)
VAIVVPDVEVLMKYTGEHSITGDLAEICQKSEVKEIIFNDIKELEKGNQLKGFEIVGCSSNDR